MSRFCNESFLPSPEIRALRSTDFEKLVLLEQQIDVEERGGSASLSSSSYYLRMCCEHFQSTSFLLEQEGEPLGYLLAFVQGREAFCGAFGVRDAGTRTLTWTEQIVARFIAEVAPQVEVVWWTLPMEAAGKRALLQRLGAVEVEHRADFGGSGRGRVLARVSKEHLPTGMGSIDLFGTQTQTQTQRR